MSSTIFLLRPIQMYICDQQWNQTILNNMNMYSVMSTPYWESPIVPMWPWMASELASHWRMINLKSLPTIWGHNFPNWKTNLATSSGICHNQNVVKLLSQTLRSGLPLLGCSNQPSARRRWLLSMHLIWMLYPSWKPMASNTSKNWFACYDGHMKLVE